MHFWRVKMQKLTFSTSHGDEATCKTYCTLYVGKLWPVLEVKLMEINVATAVFQIDLPSPTPKRSWKTHRFSRWHAQTTATSFQHLHRIETHGTFRLFPGSQVDNWWMSANRMKPNPNPQKSVFKKACYLMRIQDGFFIFASYLLQAFFSRKDHSPPIVTSGCSTAVAKSPTSLWCSPSRRRP